MSTKTPLRSLARRAAALSALLALFVLLPGAAQATAPANTGYNDTVDLIRGAGSDTTYLVMQQIEALYNASPGCTLDPGPSGVGFNTCTTATGAVGANYDHDVAVSHFQIGSSNGVKMLASASPGHPVDYARSSRDKQSSDPTGLTFNGFAKDGITVITFKGRPTGNFTQAQLQGIFVNCTITDWSQLGFPAAPIRPYGVQTGSGTYLSFRNYVGGGDPNTCANAIGPGRVLFENDTSPIEGQADAANAIWWMSFGPFSTLPAKRGTADAWQVDGKTISFSSIFDNSYPITRFLWHVTKTSADTATSGAGGATRAFRDWICKTNAQHITNPNTDSSYATDLGAALGKAGFQRMPTLESDAGTRCKKQLT